MRFDPISRRRFTAGIAATLTVPAAAAKPAATHPALSAIEWTAGGRLGVHAFSPSTGRSVGHRRDERFRLCSTFKAPLAGLALHRVDRGEDRLHAIVPFGRADLLTASPVTERHLTERAMSVRQLCEAILTRSDNAAANLLTRRCGGPAATTAFCRSLGDRLSRVDRYETALGETDSDLDTTTPAAIARTVGAMLLGPTVSSSSRSLLEGWMSANEVGGNRLRAGLPTAWRVADRTGTGTGIVADVAMVTPPGRGAVLVSAYFERPGLDPADGEEVLRRVAVTLRGWIDEAA